MNFVAWLRDRFRVVPAEERHGIALAAEDALEIPAPRDLALFIRAIDATMPRSAILYLEGGAPPSDLKTFLSERRAGNPTRVSVGTIWPRQRIDHVPITHDNLARLAQFAGELAGPQVCIHLVVYRDRQVLLSAHDVPDDPILINRHLPDDVIVPFVELLGFRRDEAKPVRVQRKT